MIKKKGTFIIAEIGINHNGIINNAKKLINVAKNCGADAVKFQTYNTHNLISKSQTLMSYQKRNMRSSISQFKMLKKCELTKIQFLELKKYCDKKKIEFISTPYDYESALMLKKIGVKKIKIASTDANNIPLIKEILKLNIETIISTGTTNEKEFDIIYKIIKKIPAKKKISYLHCISYYPCPIEILNLNVIKNYRNKYNIPIGFSDHSNSVISGAIAIALGANIIEKHITLNKKLFGPDHKSSLEPNEFRTYISNIKEAEKMLGSGIRILKTIEKKVKIQMQKSIYLINDIKKNDIINLKNIIIKRPASSLKPLFLNKILGKKAKRDIKKMTNISLGDFTT